MSQLCRCRHPKDQHFHGMCIAETDGVTCECSKFIVAGSRAKYGTAKRDILSRYMPSIDAPLKTGDESSSTIGGMVGVAYVELEMLGEETAEKLEDDLENEWRTHFLSRGTRNAKRDLSIWDRHKSGESMGKIAATLGISQPGVFVVISTVRSWQMKTLKHRWGLERIPERKPENTSPSKPEQTRTTQGHSPNSTPNTDEVSGEDSKRLKAPSDSGLTASDCRGIGLDGKAGLDSERLERTSDSFLRNGDGIAPFLCDDKRKAVAG